MVTIVQHRSQPADEVLLIPALLLLLRWSACTLHAAGITSTAQSPSQQDRKTGESALLSCATRCSSGGLLKVARACAGRTALSSGHTSALMSLTGPLSKLPARCQPYFCWRTFQKFLENFCAV